MAAAFVAMNDVYGPIHCAQQRLTQAERREQGGHSARAFTVLPFTLPALSLRSASFAMPRSTAT